MSNLPLPATEDYGLHSVRHDRDIWQQLKVQKEERTEGAHKRFGAVRESFNQAEKDLTRLFTRYEQAKADLEEQGTVATLKLSPVLEAAHRAWLRLETEKPGGKVFTEVTEAPIGPEHE